MAVVAFFCIFHGVYPAHLYNLLPTTVNWNPFTLHHLVETVQILVFTFVVFWLMRKIIAPKAKIALDVDWFYRMPADFVRTYIVAPWDKAFDKVDELVTVFARKLVVFGNNPCFAFSKDKSDRTYTPDRYRPPAQMVLMAVLIVFITAVILALFI